MMAKLSREQLRKGVICCSAGNHAQGVALSAQTLGVNAVVAMPTTTPEIKVDSLFPLYIYICHNYLGKLYFPPKYRTVAIPL